MSAPDAPPAPDASPPYTPSFDRPSAAGTDAGDLAGAGDPAALPPFPTHWPHRLPWHPRQRRLCNELRTRLTALYVSREADARAEAHRRRTIDLLLAAKRALDDGQVEAAWGVVHASAVLDLAQADAPTLRRTASSLRAECAQKLRGWRRVQALADCDAALQALPAATRNGPGAAGPAPREAVDAVAHAMRLRDQHFANVYGGIGTAHNKVVFLSLVVLAMLAGLLVLAYRRPDTLRWLAGSPLGTRSGALAEFHALLQAMGLGVLGAVFSAALERTRAAGRPLPEQLGDWGTIFVRPLLGATAAVIVLAVADAGTLGVTVESAGGLVVLCFAAGFSERFVVRFVQPVDGAPSPAPQRRADDAGDPDAEAVHEEVDASDGAGRARATGR